MYMSTCRDVQVYICIVCTIYKTQEIGELWQCNKRVNTVEHYLDNQVHIYLCRITCTGIFFILQLSNISMIKTRTSHEQCTYFRSYNVFVLLLKEFYSVFSIVFCRRWSSNCWPFRAPPISWGRWPRKWPTSFARTNTTLIWRPPFSACTTSVNKSRGAKM